MHRNASVGAKKQKICSANKHRQTRIQRHASPISRPRNSGYEKATIFAEKLLKSFEPNQGCHSTSNSVATVGVKTLIAGNRAETAAVDFFHAHFCQPLPCQQIDVGQIFS